MPNRPEDDWTRPMPRSPHGDRARPRDPEPYDSWTDSVQGGSDQPADEDWADQTRELPIGRRATAADYGYSEDEFADERWEEVEYAEAPRGRTGRRADYGGDGYAGAGYDVEDHSGGGQRRGRTGPPMGGGPRRPTRRRFRARRIVAFLLLLVLAYAASMIWAVSSIWSSIDRVDSTPTNAARPGAGSGTNFLLVGTDSREDLTRDERNDLVTGHTEGARADTIMLLHLPDGGDPVLLSIPRDSYVEIPDQGSNKINAAYSIGGPQMLVDTVEQSTGLRIDGYLEIGFGGFVEVVGTVGGVRMCLDEPVTDEKTRLDLPAGCQELAGKEALSYVRMRYGDPRGDLGRVERQREFLAALTHEMAKPATVLVPWRLHEVGTATGSAIVLGEDTSMWEAGRIALGMRSISNGDGQSLTVPVTDTNYQTAAGSSVLWDEGAAADLFTALRTGAPLSIEP